MIRISIKLLFRISNFISVSGKSYCTRGLFVLVIIKESLIKLNGSFITWVISREDHHIILVVLN